MSHEGANFRTANPKEILATLRMLADYRISGRLRLAPEEMAENDERMATLEGMLCALGITSAGNAKR